jgi:hypothetical protein
MHLLGLCLLLLAPLYAHAGSILTEVHGDWESKIVFNETDRRFRALTTYQDRADYLVLAFDRFAVKCDLQYVIVNIVASKPAETTFTSSEKEGALRVDDKPIHKITYKLAFTKGEQVFSVNVMTFEGKDTLLDELRQGKKVRFRLKEKDDEYFLRFSLTGFAEAEQKTMTLCQREAPDDKAFFEPTGKAEKKVPKPAKKQAPANSRNESPF